MDRQPHAGPSMRGRHVRRDSYRRPAGAAASDLETRQRLIDSAAELFAERGFGDVTVREICAAANANVAAINYHFGDKFGLYTAVIRIAVDAMRDVNGDAMRRAGEHGSAEQRLRRYIRAFVERIGAIKRDLWIYRLLTREFSDPTPALDLVIDEGVRPRFDYLCRLVGELIGCPPNDERAIKCVSSIQSQFMLCLPNPAYARVYAKFRSSPPSIDELADHIADFSLAGIRALARRSTSAGRNASRHSADAG
jgi:AcrR family transcriptional regulator